MTSLNTNSSSLHAINGYSAISNLSPVFSEKIKRDPSGSEKQIIDAADQVLTALSKSNNKQADAKEVQSFIKNLQTINHMINGNSSNNTLSALIEKIQTVVSSHPTTSQGTATKSKIAIFEKFQNLSVTPQTPSLLAKNIKPVSSLSHPLPIAISRPVVIIPQKSPLVLVQEKINALDLNDPKLSEKIASIKIDLDKLKKSNELTEQELREISHALDSLHLPYFYDPSIFEINLLNYIAKSTPALKKAMEKYPDAQKTASREGRSRTLKSLKSKSGSLKEFANLHKSTFNTLVQKELPQLRFRSLDPSLLSSEPFNEKFVEHLPILILSLEDFSLNIAVDTFDKTWSEILAIFEEKSGGKFGALIKHYSYSDPLAQMPELVKAVEKKYLSLFDIDKICKITSDNLHLEIEKNLKISKKNIQNFFNQKYRDIYYEMHQWLFVNISNIKKSYDQSEDANHNLGDGTCYQNCLDRVAILHQDPMLPSTNISMKSSTKGRFLQIKETKEMAHARKEQGNLSRSELDYHIKKHQVLKSEQIEQRKMKQSDKLEIPLNQQKPLEPLIKTLGTYKKNMQCTLVMLGPNVGHAINIQFHNNMFRFIDDNLGVCEYSDMQTFLEQFEEYIQTSYPNYSSFSLNFYEAV